MHMHRALISDDNLVFTERLLELVMQGRILGQHRMDGPLDPDPSMPLPISCDPMVAPLLAWRARPQASRTSLVLYV